MPQSPLSSQPDGQGLSPSPVKTLQLYSLLICIHTLLLKIKLCMTHKFAHGKILESTTFSAMLQPYKMKRARIQTSETWVMFVGCLVKVHKLKYILKINRFFSIVYYFNSFLIESKENKGAMRINKEVMSRPFTMMVHYQAIRSQRKEHSFSLRNLIPALDFILIHCSSKFPDTM